MDVLVEVKKQPGKLPKKGAIPWADHVGDIAYKVIPNLTGWLAYGESGC